MKARKGYLTVEASMIVPLAFFLIMLMIYFAFYCFDKSVSIQKSYLAALRASNQWEASKSQQMTYAKKEWEKLTKELFIMLGKKEFHVCISGNTIETTSRGQIENLFSDVSELGIDTLEFTTHTSAKIIYPAEVVRRKHVIKGRIP